MVRLWLASMLSVWGNIPGLSGSLVPVIATTSGPNVLASVFGLPVLETYLSVNQKANWGPGCYWMPVPPGFADGAISIVQQQSSIHQTIIPFVGGYEMSPSAKRVNYSGYGETDITELASPFKTSSNEGVTTQTTLD